MHKSRGAHPKYFNTTYLTGADKHTNIISTKLILNRKETTLYTPFKRLTTG